MAKATRRRITLSHRTPRPGVLARGYSTSKRSMEGYGRELWDGFIAYPMAVLNGGRRIHDELELQTQQERHLGRVMLWVWGIVALAFFLFWAFVRGFIGPMPLLVSSYFYFSKKRQRWLKELVRRVLYGDNAQVEQRSISPAVLRELANGRLRAVERQLKLWNEIEEPSERLVQAPVFAYQIMQMLGEEFAQSQKGETPNPDSEKAGGTS